MKARFLPICFFLVWGVADAEAQQITIPYAGYFDVRDGLSFFYKQVEAHVPVTVAFLGGSITYNPGWRDRVCTYLKETFPRTPFRFIAAGIPSLGSMPHAFRVQRDVLDWGKIDLLFVEAAVNDRSNGTDSLTQIRSLEGIVRQAKRNNREVGIVLMSFVDPNKLTDYHEGKEPVEVVNHELVAQYYSLPSINLAKAVYDKIQADEFSWEHDFKDLHPAPFGQQLYAEAITDLLEKSSAQAFCAPVAATEKPLPPPMESRSFQAGRYAPLAAATLEVGFRRVDHWRPTDSAATRRGFVRVSVLEAVTPGARLTLPFRGTAVGMAVVAGPDAGIVAYSIDGGPFKTFDLFARWSKTLHLPRYTLFAEDLNEGDHTLRLRVAEDHNLQSTGTACRIVHFLVNE